MPPSAKLSLRQPKGNVLPQRGGSSTTTSGGATTSKKKSLFQTIFVAAICSILSFYGGLMVGMSGVKNQNSTSSNQQPSQQNQRSLQEVLSQATIDQIKQAALEKGIVFDSESKKNIGGGGGGGRSSNARFPKSVEEFAVGMSRIERTDFISNYDIGLPMDPSTSTNSDVLILYNHKSSLPSKSTQQAQNHDEGGIPRLSAKDAMTNCNVMKVVVLDKGRNMREECTAILGQWESYHTQKWMRLPDTTKVKPDSLQPNLPLRHVSKTHNSKNQPMRIPDQRTTMKFWTKMLSKYFGSIERVLSELKPIASRVAKDNTIIVLTCNLGQSELLMNFICNAKAKGIDISQVLVFATDVETKQISEGLGLATYYDETNFGYIPSGHAVDYGDARFMGMMMAKVYSVQMVSFLGYDVLFQDVDVVWFKNPLPFFHDKTSKYADFDIYFQDDGARTSRYAPWSPNTGFYYVRNNERTQYFFSVFLRMGDLIQLSGSHQSALTQVMSEHVMWRGLRVKVFGRDDPSNDFPGGYHFNNPSKKSYMKQLMTDKANPYIFHMSWTENKINKLKYFKQMNEWYVNEQCVGTDNPGAVSAEKCCSAEPIFTCHYRDKPSKKPCKDSPPIDRGRPSWW